MSERLYPCKKRSPGSCSADPSYVWETPDDVVYIKEQHLADVLKSSQGEIYEAPEEGVPADEPDQGDDGQDGGEDQNTVEGALIDPSLANDLGQATDAANVTKPARRTRTAKPKTE